MRFAFVSALVSLVLAPASASAYAIRQATGGRAVRWAESRVQLRVDPAIDARVVADAAAAWAEAETAPALLVAGATQAEPGFRFNAENENGVYVVRGPWSHGPALAVTVTTSDESSGVILDSDVLVSARDDLVADAPSSGYDLQSVLAHELGHLLGLGESDDPEATMYPRTARGDRDARTIGEDDREGIAALYPTLPPELVSYGCATSHGSSGEAALVVLALVLALRRARRGARMVAAPALALVALLAGFDRPRARVAEVIATEVEARGGLFVTIARVRTDEGEERAIEFPGGTRGGLVQQIGLHAPPQSGDTLALER